MAQGDMLNLDGRAEALEDGALSVTQESTAESL